MESWQTLIARGNESFNQQNWIDAESFYYQAESIIEQQWQQDLNNIELLLAWVASLHNLSSLFEAQGKAESALRYLTLPHYRLLTLYQESALSEETEIMMHRAIKVTLLPLLEFSSRYPICSSCLEHLQATKEWLLSPQKILH
ncbi:MAG: hypothetical protein HRU22_09220 [Gammaproteobacteria bacterium]|nr:hypothetical protein [Gammaproteobacteria bacterium]